MLNAKCQTAERCVKADGGGKGCVRALGHTGRHKMRENPDDVFAGVAPPRRRRGCPAKLPNPQSAPPGRTGPQSEDDNSDRSAALCEIATAMGMMRVQDGDGLAWVNPQTGAAAVLEKARMDLHAASIVPDGPIAGAAPCALMNMLGIPGVNLPDGGVLYVLGGRMIVQTPSGRLRPARLEMDPALGPAGDGEGR